MSRARRVDNGENLRWLSCAATSTPPHFCHPGRRCGRCCMYRDDNLGICVPSKESQELPPELLRVYPAWPLQESDVRTSTPPQDLFHTPLPLTLQLPSP